MAQRRGIGPDDLFTVRYVSRGGESQFRISIVGLKPCGTDMQIEVVFAGSDQKSVRLAASGIIEAVNDQTGEVIDDPVSWFRFAWFDQICDDDGLISLASAIDALPVEGIRPDRSRRLAAAFGGWSDFASAVRLASDEWAALTERVGPIQARDHIKFLLAGGADLVGDGLLGEDWPLPEHIPALWWLLTIKGIGLGTVTALVEAFTDESCRRAIEEIERRCRVVTLSVAD